MSLLFPIEARAIQLESDGWQVQRPMDGIYLSIDATWFAWNICDLKMLRQVDGELLEFNYVLEPDAE
jgi:hypothetical protein